MRIAILGAAASALLGGTLAVTPLTSVSTPLPTAVTCGNGGGVCEKVASVLMPETPTPSGPAGQVAAQPAAAAPAEQIAASPSPFSAASNVISPGVATEPSGSEPSAASAVPGVASPGISAGGGSVLPELPAEPDLGLLTPGVLPFDPLEVASQVPGLLPAIGGIATAAAVPSSVGAGISLVEGVVGVGGTIVGVGSSVVGTVTTAAIAYSYLRNLGLLPNISLPSLSLPSLTAAADVVPAAAAALPAAAAALPAAGLPNVGLPAVGLPNVGLPAVGLPNVSLPAVGLPAVGLPAPPQLPPAPRFCTPTAGPFHGVCTP